MEKYCAGTCPSSGRKKRKRTEMTELSDGTIKLDIMSDPICPWCYIGKAHLDRALEAHPDHRFVIEWHPFQLNPDMPAGGMDRRAYLEGKFGGKEGAVRAYAPVVENAAKAGLKIDFEGMKRTPNTLDAHRLIHWAGIEGKQTAAVSALFTAYFVDARDIGDHEVLADIADSIGMDARCAADENIEWDLSETKCGIKIRAIDKRPS